MQTLVGDVDSALKSIHNYHQVWKQYGFTPEFYSIPQAEPNDNREGYPLRPELVESIMYLYRATKDPLFLQMGVDVVQSIQHSARTPCGFATIKDVRTHAIEDRMESFFLAETTKYLYLLFDPDNFIHADGRRGRIVQATHGECVLEAGGYIFNTEAHPIDAAAVYCCSAAKDEGAILQEFHDSMDLMALVGLTEGDTLKSVRPKRKSRFVEISDWYLDSIGLTPTKTEDSTSDKDLVEDTSQIVVRSDLVTEDYSAETSLPILGVTVTGSDSASSTAAARSDADEDVRAGEANYLGEVEVEVEVDTDTPSFNKASYKMDDDNRKSTSGGIFWAGTKPILSNVLQRDTLQSTGQLGISGIIVTGMNSSSVSNPSKLRAGYEIMTCPAQPFIQKLSLMGEMFSVN